MNAFARIWSGQMISVLGSGMTGFGLSVWVYQKTGSVTQFSMLLLCASAPGLLASVFAGALVDRYSRLWIMIASDLAAGAGTLFLAVLIRAERLSIASVFVVASLISICTAFRWPAYSAAVSTLVPSQKLGHANGMIQLAEAGGLVVPPLAAAFLIGIIGLSGVVFIDFVTYLIATGMTLTGSSTKVIPTGTSTPVSILRDAIHGWEYLRQRRGLLGLLAYFAALNFLVSFVTVLATPMVLSFAPVTMLGVVLSIGGCGMLLGALLMSIWGGGERHIFGILMFGVLGGIGIAMAGIRPSLPLVALGAFTFYFSLPIINASSQAIWQRQIAIHIQGRVFSIRRMIATLTSPLGCVVAGPMAQDVFEPWVTSGRYPAIARQILGHTPGRGIGLLVVIVGIVVALLTLATFFQPSVRNVEKQASDGAPALFGEGLGA